MIDDFFARFVPMIDAEMRRLVPDPSELYADHYGMLRYHMGWVDPAFQPAEGTGGKRVRPVLCLLACQAVGGSAPDALPAAAALELLHNFSLIHDDIQDDSPTRRHRPTVWALWGRPQAINVGDAMFTLSRMALHGLAGRGLEPARHLQACQLFDEACLRLTEGQYLDMAFENRLDVSVDEYLAMIEGKTASLLSTSLALGALVGGADPETLSHLAGFGRNLGMAFQIEDDILGIWGAEDVTGKSAASDILARKKSLPVVFALQAEGIEAQLRALYAGSIGVQDVPQVLKLLDAAGARTYAEEMAREAHDQALTALAAASVLSPENEAGQGLLALAESLLDRTR